MTELEHFLSGVFLGVGVTALIAAVWIEITLKASTFTPLKTFKGADGHTLALVDMEEMQ